MTDYNLTPAERRIEWLLLVIALLSFAVVGKGIYNQSTGINQDSVLTPILFVLYGVFFLIIALNALSQRSLVRKWMPFFFKKKETTPGTPDNSAKRVGWILLFVSIVLFVFSAHSLL